MNYFNSTKITTFLIGLIFVFSSCAMKKQQQILKTTEFKMDQEVLEVLGDSVLIAFTGTFPPNSFNKKGIANIEPYIKYGKSELPLKIFKLQGEKVKGKYQVIYFKEGGTFAYVDKVLYTPEMKKSELKLNANIRIKYADEVQDRCLEVASNKPLAKGTITTSLTQRDKDDIIISNDNFDPAKIDPKTYFANDKFETEKKVIKSANAVPGEVTESGAPTISTAVAGIANGDKIVPQRESTGAEGYYENNNTNLDKTFDPTVVVKAASAEPKKTGTTNEGYSALGNKYKVGTKFMQGTTSKGTKSSKAINTEAKYDPAKPKNIVYFGSTDIAPKTINKSTIIYYVLDTWNYRDGYDSNNPQLQELTKFAANPKYNVNGILIHSFASPEGPLTRNLALADERTNSTYSQIKDQFIKAGIGKIYDDEFYLRTSTYEDWEGWKRGVSGSNLEDKQAILSIINSNLSDEQKEAKIKAEHPASYKVMKETILPRLRRSVVSVNATLPNRTPEEIVATGKTNISDLNEKELLYFAMASTDEKEREGAYRTFIKNQPNDWRGYNNLAAILVRQGKAQEAVTALEKADKLSPNNGFIYNNLGVAYKDLKDYPKSEFYYNKAKSFGIAENNNMGNLYGRRGMYKESLASYGANNKIYNAGLSNTMLGNYDAANASLDAQDKDDKDATSYYLKAIIGARSGNAEAMGTNLRMCIEKDPRYREEAKSDLEFRKFWDKPEFQAAIR
jgi:tetratricopeptide (TPR) repeat protein